MLARALIEELLSKYREMRSLRVDPTGTPKLAMRALARRFPGALRELDELPLPLIDARVAALDAALGGAPLPAWAAWAIAYHAWLRVALEIRRRAGKDKHDAQVHTWLLEHYLPEAAEPSLADLDEACVAAILRPPEGRLNRFVLELVARRAGVSRETVEQAIFPASPQRAAP